MDKLGVKNYSSPQEQLSRSHLYELLVKCPIPGDQLLSNIGLFLSSKNISRILFLHYIYTLILDVHGVVLDLGTRWGQNLAAFASFRGIYEPFNRHRKIVGFDTFSGFPSISEKDGKSDLMEVGNITVTENYEDYLNDVMKCHEDDNPISHIKKYEVIKGDASVKVKEYFNNNPHSIVALAYFDFDIYKPTFDCLKEIIPRLVKGSVLAFDELNDPDSPGETEALQEVIGLNNVRLKRYRYASRVSYFVLE